MGKSRRSRGHAAQRKDPIAKPVKPPSDPQLAALREAKILPIIRDLQSADPKSRSAAAAAVSNIIEDEKCRKLLLREQIVHTILNQTLTDAALESRAAGWGIMRVLAQEEEADFCVHLFRLDILTAIEYAAKMISDILLSKTVDFSKAPKAEQQVALSIASSLTFLLTTMAEAQDEILQAISGNAVCVRFLATQVTWDVTIGGDAGPLRTDALNCLLDLCEDNKILAERLSSSEFERFHQTLLSLKDSVSTDGILACGVLHNIFASAQTPEDTPELFIQDDAMLIPTLSKAVADIPDALMNNGSKNGNGDENGAAQDLTSPIFSLQLALETLGNIGSCISDAAAKPPRGKGRASAAAASSSTPAPADDEEMGDAGDGEEEEVDEDGANGGGDDDDDDDDEMDDDEIEADMDIVTGTAEDDDNEDSSTSPDSLNTFPTTKALFHLAIPQLLRIASTLQPSDETTLHLHNLALGALNNLAWSISMIDFSSAAAAVDSHAAIRRSWTPIAQTIWRSVITPTLASDTADVALATQVTSLAWAVARTLPTDATPLRAAEHQRFVSLYHATRGSASGSGAEEEDDDPFQGLGVRCIGVLGALAQHPCPLELNREVGTFLVSVVVAGLPDTTPCAEAVEALNQLMDVYADESYPYDAEVFWKEGFHQHLTAALPKLRAAIKVIDKKTRAELRVKADEAAVNLERFLSYKRKHQGASGQ